MKRQHQIESTIDVNVYIHVPFFLLPLWMALAKWVNGGGAESVNDGVVVVMAISACGFAYVGGHEKANRFLMQFKVWSEAILSLGKVHTDDRLSEQRTHGCHYLGFTATRSRLIAGRTDYRLTTVSKALNAAMIFMGNSIRCILLLKTLGYWWPRALTQAKRPLFQLK